MGGAEGCQAFLGGFDFGEAAAFLFDEIVFDAAAIFGCLKKLLPGSDAFAEQDGIAFAWVWRPFLAVHRADAAGIGFDPSNGIGTGFEAGADIELENHGGLGVGEDVHGADTSWELFPFDLMVVIADA